jgi:hypothetical protein
LGRIGNTFLSSDIEKALSLSSSPSLLLSQQQQQPPPPPDPDEYIHGARKSCGIDPAWGSSAFGIIITRFVDDIVQVLYADQFERPDFNEMIQKVWELYMRFRFDGSVDRIYVDGANPSFIRSLKLMLGEREDYEKVIESHKSSKLWSDPQNT